MTTKPKTAKPAATVHAELVAAHYFVDELNRMALRCRGLEAAISGLSECGEREGVIQLADDLGTGMEAIAEKLAVAWRGEGGKP